MADKFYAIIYLLQQNKVHSFRLVGFYLTACLIPDCTSASPEHLNFSSQSVPSTTSGRPCYPPHSLVVDPLAVATLGLSHRASTPFYRLPAHLDLRQSRPGFASGASTRLPQSFRPHPRRTVQQLSTPCHRQHSPRHTPTEASEHAQLWQLAARQTVVSK